MSETILTAQDYIYDDKEDFYTNIDYTLAESFIDNYEKDYLDPPDLLNLYHADFDTESQIFQGA